MEAYFPPIFACSRILFQALTVAVRCSWASVFQMELNAARRYRIFDAPSTHTHTGFSLVHAELNCACSSDGVIQWSM